MIISCYCVSGLREARGVLDIPVIGLSEASMSVAQMLGGHFVGLPGAGLDTFEVSSG